MRGRAAPVAAVVAGALTLSGCGLGQGLYNVSLPGGADLGDHPYMVTAQFRDALDLVPQSSVKVNDVAVGRVTGITIERNGRIADVKVEVNGDVRLPANAVAAIRQTSLLGEKYVDLAAPLGVPAVGRLARGAVIGVSRTSDGVEVEQVFGALSLLLNGGGIGQLHDILVAFNRFAGGHESDIRTLLAGVNTGVAALNRQSTSITKALTALSTLAATLRSNNAQIDRVLSALAPGISILAGEQKQVNSLVDAFGRLSTVTVATLKASKDDIVADLRALAPTLSQLAQAGEALPRSLQVLLTYPFPDAALQGIKGDYLNAFARVVLNTPGGAVVRTDNWPGVTGSGSAGSAGTAGAAGATGTAGATGATGRRPAATPGSPSASAPGSASDTPVIAPPPSLLPPTTSAAPGLPSTITLPAPSGSVSGTASGSTSPSASGSGSGSASPSAAGSGSGSSAPAAPASPSGGGR